MAKRLPNGRENKLISAGQNQKKSSDSSQISDETDKKSQTNRNPPKTGAVAALILFVVIIIVVAWWLTKPSGTAEPDLVMSNVNSFFSGENSYGLPASSGHVYCWIQFEMKSYSNLEISLNPYYFELKGSDGNSYNTYEMEGPNKLGPKSNANVTLVFEVPFDWTPSILYFDPIFGPEASVTVPAPE